MDKPTAQIDLAATPAILSVLLPLIEAEYGSSLGYRRAGDNPEIVLLYGPTQAQVDAALAAYDHQTVVAEQAKAEAYAKALAAAPLPQRAAKATQQTLHALLRVVSALVQYQAPASADVDHLVAVADAFAAAASTMADAEALAYIQEQLDAADAAAAVLSQQGE